MQPSKKPQSIQTKNTGRGGAEGEGEASIDVSKELRLTRLEHLYMAAADYSCAAAGNRKLIAASCCAR